MNATPLHSVSVAGVTFDEGGRVLLIRRRDNKQWQAPGGVLELGETFEEGVAREVEEETGVQVRVDHLTGVYKNTKLGVVALVYRCRPIGGELRTTAESSAAEWLDLGEAVSRMVPAFAIRVQDAADPDRKVPASRAHDGHRLLEHQSTD